MVTDMAIPNIALFVNGRKWHYNLSKSAWVSSDGWEIAYADLRRMPIEQRLRLEEMLNDHCAMRERKGDYEEDEGPDSPDF